MIKGLHHSFQRVNLTHFVPLKCNTYFDDSNTYHLLQFRGALFYQFEVALSK